MLSLMTVEHAVIKTSGEMYDFLVSYGLDEETEQFEFQEIVEQIEEISESNEIANTFIQELKNLPHVYNADLVVVIENLF